MSLNTRVNNETWCFLQKCRERQIVNPRGTNPPPPLHLLPQCLLTVERGNMDEGTAGREMGKDVQRDGWRKETRQLEAGWTGTVFDSFLMLSAR